MWGYGLRPVDTKDDFALGEESRKAEQTACASC